MLSQPPGAGRAVGPRLGEGAELPARVHDALDDGEQVEGRAGQAVDACHRHHVAGGEVGQHPKKLPPVGLRARHLLAEDRLAAVRAELVELRVERLAVGADAGIADAPV